ncbi:MAG: 30S ribosomal protein S1, partial [Runella slithyformis]
MSKQQLADFDWDRVVAKGFGGGYSVAEKAQLEEMINGTLSAVAEKEVVKGVVVGMNDREVILNIGSKSDGIVP